MLANILIFPFFLALVFSPYFIGVNSLMHGRARGYLFLSLIGLFFGFYFYSQEQVYLTVNLFAVMAAVAFFMATTGVIEVVLRKINPINGLVAIPSVIFLTLGVGLTTYEVGSELSLKEKLKTEIIEMRPEAIKLIEQFEMRDSQDLFEIKALLMKPEMVVDSILTYGIGTFFDFIALAVWLNLFFLLRTNRLVKNKENAEYSEQVLLNIKLPPFVKWLLLGVFSIYISADYFSLTSITATSFVVLNVLGAFYFFQGFGIYLKFLDFVKLTGFIRTFLIILTMFSARPLIVIVGFVDEFIDFKKLMKKEDQGEM